MTDDELHRQVERLVQQFEADAFVVTRQLEVEAAGLAALLDVSVKRLNGWRDRAHGPCPSRTVRRVAWYSIAEIARWMEQQGAAYAQQLWRSALDNTPARRGESAPGGTPP